MYYSSEFLGHSRATDLTEELKKNMESFGLSKVVQVSMDGPNVNLRTLKNIETFLTDQDFSPSKHLLDIGTCGLHTCHNAFRAGLNATDWNIDGFLCALYQRLKDTPARRDDFRKHGKTSIYPLKFEKHR